MSLDKRNVILVTDGDRVAKRAVEVAASNIGARCISCSAGNPTTLSGEKIVELIKKAPKDPVVVMLDDRGFNGMGRGETAMAAIAKHPDIRVLGVLAVASNTENACGCEVDASVSNRGILIKGAVDKLGRPKDDLLQGDTVEIIDELNLSTVIGIGDIGKMDGADEVERGAPVTTKALKTIIEKCGYEKWDELT